MGIVRRLKAVSNSIKSSLSDEFNSAKDKVVKPSLIRLRAYGMRLREWLEILNMLAQKSSEVSRYLAVA